MTAQQTPAEPLAPEEQPTRERVSTVAPVLPAPARAPGLEMMGRLEGSGFEQTPYLVRRPDGQVVQLPPMLYGLLEEIDGTRSPSEIGERLSTRAKRGVDADAVCFLVDEKLKPLGLVADPDGSEPDVGPKEDDLLALNMRAKVVPERLTTAITTVFKPLFLPPVVLAVLAAFAAVDVWLFLEHGIAQSIRSVLYQPILLLGLFGGMVVATMFHEIGHASALRYGGGRPGGMGVGVYVVWPVMYSDVTDSYRLSRAGRLRTDLGGVYFNAIFALAVAGAYALTGYEPVLLLIVLQNFAILQQLLPLGRLDGYLVLSDLTGVPDLLNRMGPILRSAIPGRETDPQVNDLKPWVRRVATAYVVLLVPVLLAVVVLMALHAPRLFATAWDSLGIQIDKVRIGFGHGGSLTTGLAGVLQAAALVLPCLGAAATFFRLGKRSTAAAGRWAEGDPAREGLVISAVVVTAAFLLVTWWPNGEYRPIQRGERGTLQAGFRSVSELPSGRAALSETRVAELDGAEPIRDEERRKLEAERDERLRESAPEDEPLTPPDERAPLEEEGAESPGATPPPAGAEPAPPPPAGATAPAPPPASSTTTESPTSTTTTETTPTTTEAAPPPPPTSTETTTTP